MLNKLLGTRIFLRNVPPVLASSHEEGFTALKIIHMGGIVEYYYMAVPAVRIMEKYPLFLLTRPEIFRRPWDSVVHPEEILTPGQKFFVVPRRTVRKLMRRFQQPSEKSFHGITSSIKSENEFSRDMPTSSMSDMDGKTSSITVSKRSGKLGRKVGKKVMWHPSLTVIGEDH
ncbi:hypothetical protein GIB67_001062 [Kingdonia uniflora]|uniref:Uncharacterized protein n=1 Tax=Kingdonia uniflora TaxID=39325 RepID=A0A7J7MFY0_9MAGN|nr:hypothetical protein GIB67_001062 [Kingdonia uniflora]